MKMLKVIEKRRSVREYKDRVLDAKDRALVKDYINSVPQIADGTTVTLRGVIDANSCYQQLNGHAGYHGVMIKAPHYVIVTASKTENALKAGGYAGEWFVLKLTRHDIATCWISANHSEARIAQYLGLSDNEEVVGIIGYGYAEGDARVSNIYTNPQSGIGETPAVSYPKMTSSYSDAPVSGRLSVEDIVHIREWGNMATIERLEELGYEDVFYYMRLAPSSINRQPWRFLINRGEFVLCVSRDDGYDDDRLALLEAGIAMLYFEVAMHDSGYPGHWNFSSVENTFKVPEHYLLAGTYRFI